MQAGVLCGKSPVLGWTNLPQAWVRGLEQQVWGVHGRRTQGTAGGRDSIRTHFKLKAVDFDHPEGPEDLSKVGGFITVPRREAEIVTWAPTALCQTPSAPLHGSDTTGGHLLCCAWGHYAAPAHLQTSCLLWPCHPSGHPLALLAVPQTGDRVSLRCLSGSPCPEGLVLRVPCLPHAMGTRTMQRARRRT